MHFVHLTASTFFGGPERQMLGLATHLPAHVKTSFVTFREGGRGDAFLNAVRSHGFDGHTLDHDTPRLRAAIRELTLRLSSLNATHLLCHGYKANLLGRIAAHNNHLPAISVSRGWTGEDAKVRLYERLDRWLLNRSDHVISVSDGQAAKVRACGVPDHKLTVIRNAARLEAFKERDATFNLKLKSLMPGNVDRIVVAAGRLSPEKGFEVLVTAAARTPSNIGFVLFGEGIEQAKLEAMIQIHRLGHRFILAGQTTELDHYLPWADAVVLPSYTEGLPNVALEASAAGVPVIATAVGGTPEVIADGVNGFLVNAGDDTAMAKRIVELCDSESLRTRMGQAGQAKMRREFTFDAQARQYVELLGSASVALKRAA